MLTVVEMAAPAGKPHVTITSDKPQHNLAIAELSSPAARKLAIEHAARNGVINARCEMSSAPYPVDEKGEMVVNPVQQKIAAYRVDVPISTGM